MNAKRTHTRFLEKLSHLVAFQVVGDLSNGLGLVAAGDEDGVAGIYDYCVRKSIGDNELVVARDDKASARVAGDDVTPHKYVIFQVFIGKAIDFVPASYIAPTEDSSAEDKNIWRLFHNPVIY